MIYESELYHHGIRGQKWGKRNGPPYPLSLKEARQKRKQNRVDKNVSKLEARKDYTNRHMDNSINEFKNSKNVFAAGKNYLKADINTSSMSTKKLLAESAIIMGSVFAAGFYGRYWERNH